MTLNAFAASDSGILMTTLPLLADLPENPVPRGTVSGEIITGDKVRIRYARWAATARRKRGTILLLHGRSEFVEKYFETANDLRRRGFAAVTFDWRGQGGSQRFLRDRNKGHIDSFGEYVRDLDAVMKQVVLADCPPPYYIMAHSTGSAAALLYARRARTQIERMVLLAPLLGLAGKSRRMVLFTTGLAQFFGFGESYVPGGGRTLVQTEPFEGNPVTSDRQRHDRTSAVIAARPDLGLGSPTISWVHAAMRAAESFDSPDFPASVTMPVLMVMAGRESLVSNRAVENLSSRMKTGAHTLIPGARHEILSEADVYRDQFWAAFDAFVD